MHKTIDIDVFKENPQLFFSKLDKEAEKEFAHLLEYIIFKYNIEISSTTEKTEKILKKIPGFINNPIQRSDFKLFSREELYEK